MFLRLQCCKSHLAHLPTPTRRGCPLQHRCSSPASPGSLRLDSRDRVPCRHPSRARHRAPNPCQTVKSSRRDRSDLRDLPALHHATIAPRHKAFRCRVRVLSKNFDLAPKHTTRERGHTGKDHTDRRSTTHSTKAGPRTIRHSRRRICHLHRAPAPIHHLAGPMKFPSEPVRAARAARVKASAVATIQQEALGVPQAGTAFPSPKTGRWKPSVTGPVPDHRSAGRRDSGRAGRKKAAETGRIGSHSAAIGPTRTGTSGVDGRPGSVLSLSVYVCLPVV